MVISSSSEPIADQSSAGASSLEPEYVSVVIPCYNEERFIGKALANLADQYDPEHYEIIIVDGMSEDRTREVIAEFSQTHPEISVRIIDNPAQTIPRAINIGVAAARGEIIARIDAHAVASETYIRRCVDVLRENADSVVGMPCRINPGAETIMARAIALAVSHPFGIGDAKYRLSRGKALQESVDTVAFACFRKSLWQQLGGFNEQLLTNEDYDFNYRVRSQGGRVLLDRSGYCDYFSRPTLSGVAAQYLRYGGWKAQMVKLHPRSIKLRHLVAPAFIGSIVLLGSIGELWSVPRWLLAVEIVTYLMLSFVFAIQATAKSRSSGFAVALVLPIVFLTIHVTWGTSFLFGLFRPSR